MQDWQFIGSTFSECHKSRNNIKAEWIHILKAQLGESHLGNATNFHMRVHIFKYNQIKRLSVRDRSLFYILLWQLRDSYWNWISYTRSCANSCGRKGESVLSRACNPNIIPSAPPVYSHTQERNERKTCTAGVIACIFQAAAAHSKHVFKGESEKKGNS